MLQLLCETKTQIWDGMVFSYLTHVQCEGCLILQPKYSTRLVVTCHLALVCAIGAWLLLLDMRTSLVNLSVYSTSVAYWNRPVKGFRRALDMATSAFAIFYHIRMSYHTGFIIPYLSVVLVCAVMYCWARRVRDECCSSTLHCSLHIIGAFLNMSLYSRITMFVWVVHLVSVLVLCVLIISFLRLLIANTL